MHVDFVKDLLVCDCSSVEHQIVFQYFEDDNSGEVYLQVHLTKKPFWKRLIHAFFYVLGYQSRFGAFDEVIMGPQHIKSLQSVIEHIRKAEGKSFQLSLYNDERHTDL